MNKSDKAALAPRLRFPEFVLTEEWQAYTLDKIADRLTEKVGDKQLTTLSISAGVGFVSQAEKFSRDISGKQYDNYIFLQKGDFSYNKGNSKKFPQGCIYELKEYDEAAVPNAFISFRFNKRYVSDFYKGYFENNFHGKQLIKFITSGARMDGLLNINPSDFFSIILPTPKNKAEQQKIADCLSSIDDLIAAEDKKLETLRAHKKGLVQKLFPAEGKAVPEWRFPEFRSSGEWEEKLLAQVGDIITGNTPSTADVNNYGGNKMFVSPADMSELKYVVETKTKLTEKGFSTTRKIPANSVLFVCIGSTIGKVAQNKCECATNQQINSVVPFEDYINDFIYYALELNSSKISKLAGKQAVPIINKSLFSSVMISTTEYDEQQKIANCLSSIDDLISEQAKKIEALKTHKKGLMQGLFPSIEEA
ncbi:MAG: restriction endonuclease subunit S [Gracilibacteraceae bacterium]|jgi:type I restriction enzyme S subunit|nr:restriction endonuclease subunit S [Gracilibacteraceae bacterium]